MTHFDFKNARHQIEQILAVVETCPDSLKEKCFELLFAEVFSRQQPRAEMPPPQTPPAGAQNVRDEATKHQHLVTDYKLPANILAFMRKFDVPIETLQKLFILDHEPLLPVYKITTKVMATAQLQKVMMILLENGLLNNQLKAPYPELRDSIREAGLMDSNFNKALKKNHSLFKGAVTKDKLVETETIELTGEGYTRLAQIVKELAEPTQ